MSDPSTTEDEHPLAEAQAEAEALAGRGARLGAYLLDWLLVGLIAGVIAYYAGLFERVMEQDTEAALWLGVIALVVYMVVNGRLLANRGQTVGKMAVGVRIVDAKTRDIVAFWKSFGLRIVAIQAITTVPLVGGLLGLVNVLFIFGERRRCLHDHLAGTIVVRVEES